MRRAVRGARQRGIDGVRTDLTEPVGRISAVGFLTMHNGMPVAAFGGGDVLSGGVCLVEAREVDVQAAHRSFGRVRSHEEPGG